MTEFGTPNVKLADQGNSRVATVQLQIAGGLAQYISVSFEDKEQPDETNAAERARILAKAKELFAEVSSIL